MAVGNKAMLQDNYRRPHEGLNNATPKEWIEKIRSGDAANALVAFATSPDPEE